MPSKNGTVEDDELLSMLWGDAGHAGSDGENETAPVKKRKTGNGNGNAAARQRKDGDHAVLAGGSSQPSEAGGNADRAHGLFSFTSSSTVKKNAMEARELDKAEAMILQANQLKLQVGDSQTIMSVSMSKTNTLLEKIEGRLSAESTKVFVEMIKSQGAGCRAETVWQNLKDCKNMVQKIGNFLEALHDKEATGLTLQTRAAALRDVSCSIPTRVNNVICQRTIIEFFENDEMDKIIGTLDPDQKAQHPDGIASVLPSDLSTDALQLVVKEFQSGCIIHLINQCFLAGPNQGATEC